MAESKVKGNPLQAVANYVSWAKRKVQHDEGETAVLHGEQPLSTEQLVALCPTLPDHARLHFSLALSYLMPDKLHSEAENQLFTRRALACLRCAEALECEEVERITLYRGLIEARNGHKEEARETVSLLVSQELTTFEQALYFQLMNEQVEANTGTNDPLDEAWLKVKTQLEAQPGMVRSLLVLGDWQAITADWLPSARCYFAAANPMNGLAPGMVTRLNLTFDLGIASANDQRIAQMAGVQCARWLTVEGAI